MEFCALKELCNLKFNFQMIKVGKLHTHSLYLYPKCHTKLEGKFEFLFKFHLNLKLNLWSQNFTNYD